MGDSLAETGRILKNLCNRSADFKALALCFLFFFFVVAFHVQAEQLPDDLHEMTCGHRKAPKQVQIVTKPSSHIFLVSGASLNYIGSSNTPVLIECCKCKMALLFSKTPDPIIALKEMQSGSGTGYKNNLVTIEEGYFATHDRWPESGDYILESYSALDNVRIFISTHLIPVISVSSIVIIVAVIMGIRFWRERKFIDMALRRADDAGMVSRAEMTIAAGELGDLRGKSLKGQYGTYQLKSMLGEGGMSMVYEGWRALDDNTAYDTVHETYAIKIMLPSVTRESDFSARFKREISVYLKLKHPGVVQLHDWGEDHVEKVYFMVLEKVSGCSLADEIKKGRITIPQAVSYMLQALDAIDFAHRHDVVHRDIKPQNMYVTGRNNMKILDFGIARKLDTTGITATDVVLGTPQYLPPEQLDAKTVDGRADLYSLGVVFYEMACGTLPFTGGTTMEIITKHVTQKPPKPSLHNPDIHQSIEDYILRLLEKKPENRFKSAKEAREALMQAALKAGIEV
jgi:hypothetical protein